MLERTDCNAGCGADLHRDVVGSRGYEVISEWTDSRNDAEHGTGLGPEHQQILACDVVLAAGFSDSVEEDMHWVWEGTSV